MLQIIFSKIQGNKMPKVNNDTLASKLVHRGLSSVLLYAFMHSIWLTYHGQVLLCGENKENTNFEYINAFCWSLGVHIYGNRTEILHARTNSSYTVHQSFYSGLPGRAEKEENKLSLTKISLMPAFLFVMLMLSMHGRSCWNFLQKNLLTELIGILDTRKTSTSRYIIPKKADRNSQINETYETLLQHSRFYDDYAMFYIGCTGLNLLTLIVQYFFLVIFIGEWDHHFAVKVADNFFVEYKKWPLDMLTVLPSIVLCQYSFVQATGTPLTIYFLCSMKWNRSYLMFFAALWYMVIFCIAMTIASLLYWILFLSIRYLREFIVKRTLKLDWMSPAVNGMARLSGGTLFIILLLDKSFKTEIVCKILKKVSRENAAQLARYRRGLQ